MTEVLIVGQDEVPDLLPMDRCIDLMTETLSAVARGEAELPLRQMVPLPAGILATMPAAIFGVAGVKVITVFPGNEGTELDSHQGIVVLFELERGRPLALVDATSVTAIRTAAVSGAATRALAREDAGDLAILGSGTQARTHLEAMRVVRDLRRVRVWSRTAEHAKRFAERESERHGIAVEVAGTAREAVKGAELVCTTTSAREPVLAGEWLSPGAHLNAVGYGGRDGRELDGAAVARARMFCDRRESVEHESGDYLLALAEGAIGVDHLVGELGEVLIGKVEGRTSPEDITLFESLGLAVEDVASVKLIHERATATGAGTRVALGGLRQD